MRDDESDVNQMFQRAAGGDPSADDALARIRPRIRRAHQRRAAVRGGVGLVGVVALGAIVARSGNDGVNRLRVASTGSTVETTTVALPSPVVSSSVAPTTATSMSQSMARSQVVPPPPSATCRGHPRRSDLAAGARPDHGRGDDADRPRDPAGARVGPHFDVSVDRSHELVDLDLLVLDLLDLDLLDLVDARGVDRVVLVGRGFDQDQPTRRP